MTGIDRHFPLLEPPPGGLQRLRARLDRPRGHAWLRPVPALAVVLAVVVSILWGTDIAQTRHREALQLEELRQTLAAHRRPELAINGQEPSRMALNSDRLEVYIIGDSG